MSTTTSSYPSQLYHHQSLYNSRDSSSDQQSPTSPFTPRAHPPLPRSEPPPPPPPQSQPQPQPQQPPPSHHHQHHQHHQHLQQHQPSFLRKDIYSSGTSASLVNPYPDSSEHMSSAMTDTAVHQQSKRLAGMSITNSSGTKVSILNDSPLDVNKASIKAEREYENRPPPPIHCGGNGHPPPPPPPAAVGLPPLGSRSPHFRDHRRDYYADDRKDPYYHPATVSTSSPHRQRSDSYEEGRSTSLTNAATPFRSGFDTRPSETASRSRSLSSSAQLYPYSSSHNGHYHHHHHHHGYSPSSSSPSLSPYVGNGASPLPFFMRAFSEDTAGSDEHESSASGTYRGLMHPGLPEGLLTGPSLSKRKYSCTHPGCNKRFTTSGHLARHNRIHTGERNFSCLMPGCPSKFSRQDNMMQHYRTHISPKSRRGANAKKSEVDGENAMDENAETEGELLGAGEQEQSSPTSAHPSSRFYPAEQQEPESMDQDEQVSSSVHSPHGSFVARDQHHHQQHHHHQHHQHLQQQERDWSVPASPTSPMTRVADRMEDVMTTSSTPPTSSSSSSSSSSGSSSSSAARDQQLFYYRQQQQYQQQYQQRQQQKQQQQQAASHASAYYHAAAATQSSSLSSSPQSSSHHHGQQQGHSHSHSHSHSQSSKHMVSPTSSLPASSSELHPHAYSYPHSHMHLSTNSSSGGGGGGGRGMTSMGRNATMGPPSPQSTPVTPTKYRFDPIKDCLQQERRQREEATL